MFLVINRYDIGSEITDEIVRMAGQENIGLLGCIPYDPTVIDATRRGIPVTGERSPASEAIHRIAQNLVGELAII